MQNGVEGKIILIPSFNKSFQPIRGSPVSLLSLSQAGDPAAEAEVRRGAATCPVGGIAPFSTQVAQRDKPKGPTHLPGIPGF